MRSQADTRALMLASMVNMTLERSSYRVLWSSGSRNVQRSMNKGLCLRQQKHEDTDIVGASIGTTLFPRRG